MSSRRIGSTPFLELLPDSIAGDPAIRAAADALDGLLVPSVKAIPSLLLYARLYGKEPDLLPRGLPVLSPPTSFLFRLRSRYGSTPVSSHLSFLKSPFYFITDTVCLTRQTVYCHSFLHAAGDKSEPPA